MSAEKTFADFEVGDEAQFEVLITGKLVADFAELSGDRNPLHTDEVFAKDTQFGHTIAHGMIGGALFSRLVGMYLPGRHALYMSQTLKFNKPIFQDTTVVVKGKITQKVDAFKVLKINTVISDKATGEVLTDGEAAVGVLR